MHGINNIVQFLYACPHTLQASDFASIVKKEYLGTKPFVKSIRCQL
jgi:hypothetical protein